MAKVFLISFFLLSGRLGPGGSSIRGLMEASGSSFVNSQDVSSDQGIEGIVYPVSGNRMPAPNRQPVPGATAGGGGSSSGAAPASPAGSSSGNSPSGSPRGVKSTVYVFELTNISQVTRQGQTSYYVVVNTKLVKQADTDDTGYFKIALPPGRYSVFTRKGDLFYASRRDEKNNIAPVEVAEGKFTRFDCKIEGERKAVY